jgi:hypothetical protein
MRTVCVRAALALAFLLAWSAMAQTTADGRSTAAATPARPKRSTSAAQVAEPAPEQTTVQRPAYGIEQYSPLAAAGGYRRHRETFWEFWWHRFNPRNVNYGVWIERRRQMFLEQAGANRYFWFSFWAFAGICFLLLWATKERIDRKETEWEAAECLADLANYADYCKRNALEAIHRHNDHIEVCNRVIESAETGRPVTPGSDSGGDWKGEVQKLRAEVADKSAEVVKLSADLAQKGATVADLNTRINELARNQNDKTNGAGANPNLDLVARMNRLTAEVQALREENSRLKRANQNAGSGERVR